MTIQATAERQGMNWARSRSLLIEAAIVIGIALFFIVVIPAFLSGFRLNLMGRFLALAIAALGIDLIWGFTGLLSLGHGVFFTLGGYAIAMYLTLQTVAGSDQLPEFMSLYGVDHLPWFWEPFHSFGFAVLAVLVIPGVMAAILGYLVFRNRIRGVYFSILTQAMTIIFFNFFNGQQKLVNGTNGLTNFKTFLGATISSDETQRGFYVMTVVLLAIAYAFCRWLTSGRFGRLLIAIRDDESRVRFSGYDPTGFKVLVFAVSGALAGLAGAAFVLQTQGVSPKTMDIAFSIEMVIWVAIGGRATLSGAVLGALLVNLGKSLLSEQFPDIWLFFLGGLFLLVVLALPDGLIGWFRSQGVELFRSLTGRSRHVSTYPRLEEDAEVQHERQNLGD
jgi:urea transport system permease protein